MNYRALLIMSIISAHSNIQHLCDRLSAGYGIIKKKPGSLRNLAFSDYFSQYGQQMLLW